MFHLLKSDHGFKPGTSPTISQPVSCLHFVREEWLFVREPNYQYPVGLYIIDRIFLALRLWFKQRLWWAFLVQESNTPSRGNSVCNLAAQYLQCFPTFWITIHLRKLDVLWECLRVLHELYKAKGCRPPASDTYRPKKFLLDCPCKHHQEQSACLGHWRSDTQLTTGFWSSFSTPRRSVIGPWAHAHNEYSDLLVTEHNP